MNRQTATIRITNGIIPIPSRWADELDGREASITKVDGVLLVTPIAPTLDSLYEDVLKSEREFSLGKGKKLHSLKTLRKTKKCSFKMIEIFYSPRFGKLYRRLPAHLQQSAEEKELVFRTDPFDPRLDTHKLGG